MFVIIDKLGIIICPEEKDNSREAKIQYPNKSKYYLYYLKKVYHG